MMMMPIAEMPYLAPAAASRYRPLRVMPPPAVYGAHLILLMPAAMPRAGAAYFAYAGCQRLCRAGLIAMLIFADTLC